MMRILKKNGLAIFLLFQLFGLFHFLIFFNENGYLPSPFHYDKHDTFMDYFHTLYWTYSSGRYTEWHSVYPPLAFYLVKFIHGFSYIPNVESPYLLREIFLDDAYRLICIACVIPMVVISTKNWAIFNLKTRCLIYLTFMISAPMLFALERLNLIVVILLILPLIFINNEFLKVIAIAVLINLKPYFAILSLYFLYKNDYKNFVRLILVSGFIYVMSGLCLDSKFYLLIPNIFSFGQVNHNVFSLKEVTQMPSSISVFTIIFENMKAVAILQKYISIATIKNLSLSIEIIRLLTLFATLALLYVRRHTLSNNEIFTILLVFITNIGVSVGGYSYIFYLVIIPTIVNMTYKRVYIGLLLIIACNYSFIPPLMMEVLGAQDVFFLGESKRVLWVLLIDSLLKPIANYVLLLVILQELAKRMNDNNKLKLYND